MVHRQKIYLGLAISVGVFTGIGAYLLYRHRRKLTARPISIHPLLQPPQDSDYLDRCSSSEQDNDDLESLQSPSKTMHSIFIPLNSYSR